MEVTALRAAVTENETRQAEREALIRQHARTQYQVCQEKTSVTLLKLVQFGHFCRNWCEACFKNASE